MAKSKTLISDTESKFLSNYVIEIKKCTQAIKELKKQYGDSNVNF